MLLDLPGLTQLIEAADYDEYVFNLQGIDFQMPLPTVRLSLMDTEGTGSQVDFLLAIAELTAFAIHEYSWLGGHDLTDAHPLLLAYQEPHSSLYIKGRTEHPKELAFDLLQIHLATYGQWRPFNPRIFEQLQQGNALLAEGPHSLLQQYAAKVNEYGILTSLLPSYTPDPSNLKVLTLGDNYFIGSRFEFGPLRESE